jgi:hypothetical protein
MLINDRQITISAGSSRRATVWQPQTLLISELYEKLRTPARGTELQADYLAMKKSQQDDLKDVGGFVGGRLTCPRRKPGAVAGRDIITLDMDNLPAGSTNDILRRLSGLGCSYCVYSTRKHMPAAPRLRVLIPTDRPVTADEYEPIARKIAQYIDPGMTPFDPTTFQISRLMYWPSCSADAEYIYAFEDKPLLSADGTLQLYADWRDISSWPQVPGAAVSPQRLAAKQGDPTEKTGVVGAFCRVYDVLAAMDKFLPGIYEPVDNMPNRYTFTGGSTAGGAIVYDDGKFLYSHHATDPCSGKLVNAFDLVRIHKFGDLDDDAKPDTPTNKLQSFLATCEFALQDPSVRHQMSVELFSAPTGGAAAAPAIGDWVDLITRDDRGGIHKTLSNIMLLIQNAPELHGCAMKDEFSGRIYAAEGLPWRTEKGYWSDADTTELRKHFETVTEAFDRANRTPGMR